MLRNSILQPSASTPMYPRGTWQGSTGWSSAPLTQRVTALPLQVSLVGVPLSGRLDALLAQLLLEIERLQSVVREGLAEQVSARGIAALGLVPHLAVRRSPDIDARVVPLLARHRRESPLDMEDEIGENLVQPKPLVAAVTLANEDARGLVERPLRLLG